MLISWDEVVRISPPIRGVIHIGAHRAQERVGYLSTGLTNIIWIEANPGLAKWLAEQYDESAFVYTVCNELVFNFAICDEDYAERDFYVASNDGESSSLLVPKVHIEKYPDITFDKTIRVPTIQLDTLIAKHDIEIKDYNFINMDIQGAELLALMGMVRTLPYITAIFAEINFIEMYKDCALVNELDAYLDGYGFQRRLTFDTGVGWGDALYINRSFG